MEQQFAVMAALGLRHTSLRFVDVGTGIKNTVDLDDNEMQTLKKGLNDFGLSVSSLGSPLGKVKLLDQEDGTTNAFIPFETYLQKNVHGACQKAVDLGTKLVRGFSFYHPKDSNPEDHLEQACDYLGQISDVCQSYGLVYGLEVEANLIGQTGQLMASLYEKIARENLCLIFDGANLSTQGFSTAEIYEQFQAMNEGLGWVHIKDYKHPGEISRITHVDEESLRHFVPADQGDSGHTEILADLRTELPTMESRMKKLGVDGIFLDLEPHVRGGGQFGGFSGPDGFGVALRGLCNVLDEVGIHYNLRQYEDL